MLIHSYNNVAKADLLYILYWMILRRVASLIITGKHQEYNFIHTSHNFNNVLMDVYFHWKYRHYRYIFVDISLPIYNGTVEGFAN